MRNPWISHLTMYLFLAQGLSAQSGREILGMVFHRGENGDPVQEHGVIVTWTETGNSDETNDQGIFRLPLLAKSQPGDPITLATDKVGWRIRYPLDGETLVPRHPEKAMQVELLPLGSKLFWSDDDRIEKFIREVAERSKREGMREGQNQPLELGLYLREWAAKYGFSPQEAREQVDRWIAEVDARHDDNYRQGLADFAKLHFDQAAVRFHDSAERSIRQLEELGIQQSQLANQTAAVREQVVRDLRLEGNSHYQAYRYEEALTAYERAHQFTSREETLKLWAATLEEIGEAHRSLGSYGPTAESTEHLSRALSSFRQILLAVSREQVLGVVREPGDQLSFCQLTDRHTSHLPLQAEQRYQAYRQRQGQARLERQHQDFAPNT